MQIPELHEEDVGGVTIRKTVESVILDGITRSVVMCHYVQMVLEGNVIDSVGRNMLRLEASLKSKSQTRKF